MSKTEMPAIKTLLTDSWTTFKSSFGSIFLLSLFGSIIGITVTFFSLIAVVGVGFLSTFGKGMTDKAEIAKQVQSFLTPEVIGQIGFGLLLVFILGWVISTVVRIGIIYTIGKSKEKPSLGKSLNVGFSLLIPTMVISTVTSFVTFGSSFLFIIPAIIISFLFYFVSYEMILGDKKWFSAISGSVQIMSQHFGEVLLRVFLFAVGTYAIFNLPLAIIQMIVKGFSEKSPVEAASILGILGLIRFIFGIFTAFYGMVYGVVTYQHAKRVTDESVKPSLTWIAVVTVIGWLIALLISLQLAKLIKSPAVQEKISEAKGQLLNKQVTSKSEQQKIKGWKENMVPDVKKYYDESNDIFALMRTAQKENPKMVKELNDKNIATIKKALALDDKNPEIWMNLSSAFTWQSSSGTLKDSLSASEKAESLDPSISTYAKNSADIMIMLKQYDKAILKLQQVLRVNNNYGLAHISLGVAYKRTGLKDSAREELQKGIDILSKYNESGSFDGDILQAKKELESI